MAVQEKEYWRRKLVVKNIPVDWSCDLIRNFLEVVTGVEVAEDGIEYFADIAHTALVTFTEVLTDECISEAQSQTRRKDKPLVLVLIKEGPSSVLVYDLDPSLTQDNLFYYFDSPRSGGIEGEVLDDGCELYPDLDMAVVTFTSSAVVADVLAVPEHCPSRGTRVRVEPCYDEFHKSLLLEVKHVSSCSSAPSIPVDTRKSVQRTQSTPVYSPDQQRELSEIRSEKSGVKIKPPLHPKPKFAHIVSPGNDRGGTDDFDNLAPAYADQYPSFPQRTQSQDARSYASRPKSMENPTDYGEEIYDQPHDVFPQPFNQCFGMEGPGNRRLWRGNKGILRPFTIYPPRRTSSEDLGEQGIQNVQFRPRGRGRNRRRPPRRGNNRGGRGNYRSQQEYGDGVSQAYRDGSPQRYRGRGWTGNPNYGFVSRARESEELVSYSNPRESPGLFSAHPAPAMPRPVIRLDADCNPCLPEPYSEYLDTDGGSSPQGASNFESPYAYSKIPPPVPARQKKVEFQPQPNSGDSTEETFYSDEDNATYPAGTRKQGHCGSSSNDISVGVESSAKEAASQATAEREKQLQAELERMRREKEQLENEKLLIQREKEQLEQQKLTPRHLSVAPYKLRLLKKFAEDFKLCKVTVFDGEILFYTTEDKCAEATCEFLKKIQDLHEDNLSVPSAITTILQRPQGQQHLKELNRTDSRCSLELDVQNSCIICAAHTKADLDKLLKDLKRNVRHQICKVPSTILSASADLQALKVKLENEYLVQLTLPTGGSDHIVVDGINGDVDMALREVQNYVLTNQPGQEKFHFSGALAEKAIAKWYYKDMDDAKALILTNGGAIQQAQLESDYILVYQCRKDMIEEVKSRLAKIKQGIVCTSVDLHAVFTSYSERALVINGLHVNGQGGFCVSVQETVKRQTKIDTILDISLPPKCSLPKLRYATNPSRRTKPQALPSAKQFAPAKPQIRLSNPQQFHTYTTSVGNTSVIVKTGDISKENSDVLVNILGEDLDMKGTSVGSSIMRKYPQVAQELQVQSQQQGQVAGCRVISGTDQLQFRQLIRRAVGGAASDPLVLHVVLKKLSEPSLSTTVKQLTQQCLSYAVRLGKRSIAFPPLGVGKKFRFPKEAVANTMVSTIVTFLQGNAGGSLQNVTFVIYDIDVAKKFKVALMQTAPGQPTIAATHALLRGAAAQQQLFRTRPQRDPRVIDHAVYDDYIVDDVDCAVDDDDIALFGFGADSDGGGVGGSDDDDGGQSSSDEDSLSFFDLTDDRQEDLVDLQYPPAAGPSRDKLVAQICTQDKGALTKVRDILVKELKSTFLYMDSVQDITAFKKLGQKAVDEIQALAMKENVVLRVFDTGKDGKVTVCGQRAGVVQVVASIKDKISKHSSQDRREGRSSHRHKVTGLKNTRDIPNYWKISQKGVLRTFEDAVRSMMKYGKLHAVDADEQKAIESLIKATWMPQFIGHGKDGVGLAHKSIQVLKVERLENPHLWEGYSSRRESYIMRQETSKKLSFTPVGNLPGSSGPVKTTSSLSKGSALCRKIYPVEINEHYLFHGTKKEYMEAIVNDGLDNRISSDNAMLGRGIYASESATKADQYTDDKRQRTSGNKTMILVRILLGQPYLNKAPNPTKYNRPPCMKCAKDRCTGCKGAARYDSVIDDAGRNFREFVVYESQLCYPEYFITYQRV